MGKKKNLFTRMFGRILLFLVCCLAWMPGRAEAAVETHSLSMNAQWVENSLADKDNVQVYTFATPSAGYVELSFCSFAEGQRWELLDADLQKQSWGWIETLWGTSESNPKSVSKARWLEAGTYQIRVSCYNGEKSVGKFWVKAAFRAAGNNEQEPNQTYAQAQSTAFGTEVRGLLSEQDTNDYYTFSLSQAQNVTIQVKCYCSGIRVRLMDSNLKVVNSDTIWGGSESSPKVYEKEISLTPGTYYVHVDAYSSDARGLYDYKVTAGEAEEEKTLTVEETSVKLYRKQKVKLHASTTPSGTITYTSSDSRIAKVNKKGKITAVKKGKCKIYVRANGIEKIVNVKVKEPVLKVEKTKIALAVNQKHMIQCTVKPAATVVYQSSNKQIATVNKKGKIKARQKGTCRIYVKANGMTRTIQLTVK